MQDADLKTLDFFDDEPAEKILEKIISGRRSTLIRRLDPRDEKINLMDRRLNRIYREVNTISEESGSYDLFVGYPFVEGRFLDGGLARCPICLFPVRLERDYSHSPRWRLVASPDEDIQFNKTFFLAYEKFQQVRLSREFWETHPDHFPDIQAFLNWLYAFFKENEIGINFNPDLFQFKLDLFYDYNKDRMEKFQVGSLKLQSHAILGIFPQSDSALMQDYDLLERDPAQFSVENYLRIQKPSAEPDPYIREEHRFFVTSVDQSQEEALLKVKNGHSIVLHGPPGTGKSQVILNLIADAMARGLRVLVVSQKRAALDVVYHRLAELDLHRYAALVHDFRADRTGIFARISQQIESIESYAAELGDLTKTSWEHNLKRLSRETDTYNHFYEELFQSLKKVREFGLSMHELYLKAEAREELFLLKGLERKFDLDALEALLTKLDEWVEFAEILQPSHPWYQRVNFAKYGFGKKQEIKERLEKLPAEVDALHQSWLQFGDLKGDQLDAGQNERDLTQVREWYAQLEQKELREDFEDYFTEKLKPKEVKKALDGFEKWFGRMAGFQILSEQEWSHYLDLKEHFENFERQKESLGRFFSLKWLKARWYLKKILEFRKLEYNAKNLSLLKKEVSALDSLMKHYLKVEEQAFFNDLPLTEPVSALNAWLERKRNSLEFFTYLEKETLFTPLQPRLSAGKFDSKQAEKALKMMGKLEEFTQKLQQQTRFWGEILHTAQFQPLVQAVAKPSLAAEPVQALTQSFAHDFEDLRALDAFVAGFSIQEKEVLEVLLPSMAGFTKANEADFLKKVRNSFYLAWIEDTEARDPNLGEVSSKRMEKNWLDYRHKITERQKNVTGLIHHKLRENIVGNIKVNRLGNPVTYREIAHQVNKKRLVWSVRKLVSEFWNEGLSTLMPCWLASPESVAAIFPMETKFFDLVIFDEASQCYVERAFPIMLRGDNCVIAGDEKQLPPFDLYSVKVEEGENAFYENEMALEVESVLDLAKNVFHESKLSWHYRSREEELINFSNHAFYEGRLNVIPPAHHDPVNLPPIEWIKVENGVWERNSNRSEGEAVVDLILKLVRRADRPSIGVVTFNFHQQELIRDIIDRRLLEMQMSGQKEDLALLYQALERTEQEERQGIFVKNIENVQGDERDVIIFSVGYARDRSGRMVSHFGLLSQAGGQNRLNVAITRARQKVYVLCSVEPETFEVEDAKHPGPRLFRKYLEYARAVTLDDKTQQQTLLDGLSGSKALIQGATADREAGGRNLLADQVARALEAEGLTVIRQVGDTNYKLDLAIQAAGDSKDYLLGIECEGPNYFSGKSAKEREIYRVNLLESRGWKVHRVWSRNWFWDREGEIQRILARLKTT